MIFDVFAAPNSEYFLVWYYASCKISCLLLSEVKKTEFKGQPGIYRDDGFAGQQFHTQTDWPDQKENMWGIQKAWVKLESWSSEQKSSAVF